MEAYERMMVHAKPGDAADRIAALEAENARLRTDLRETLALCEEQTHKNARLADDLAHGKLAFDAVDQRRSELQAENARLNAFAEKVHTIRNNIVRTQTFNWSRDMYPLVEALSEVGLEY